MKIIFLDRDGVINKYPGDRKYVNNLKEFSFIPGSIEGIIILNRCGFKLFVISNQAGVAKGLYSEEELDRIDNYMLETVKQEGGLISGIYYCTHHPDDNCNCRKPKTGLLEQAVANFSVKPEVTFFIGDSFYDMRAARNFGAKAILVLSGRENLSNRDKWEFEPDYVFNDLLSAANFLNSQYG